jgi:hypothetical protein
VVGSAVYFDVPRIFFGVYEFECLVVRGGGDVEFVVGDGGRRLMALDVPPGALGRCLAR